MLVRRWIVSSVHLLIAVTLLASFAAAQSPPLRLQNDDEEDAALDCFECSRGELLTFDMRTGEVIRRTPPEAVPDVLRLLSESGQGALVPPDDLPAPKDFGFLSEVHNTTIGDYPKHVKIFSTYTDEHGEQETASCSGTMIDPFHVLTAGHCIYMHEDGDGDDVDAYAHTVEVHPGFDEWFSPFGKANAVQLHAYSGWTQSEDFDWDIAVIDLDWPIGALSGWRGYGSDPNCGWYTSGYWEHFGYPGDVFSNGLIMYTQSGQFDDCESSGNEVSFDREMYKGQSGGGCVRDGGLYTVRSNKTWVGPGPDDYDTYDVRIINTMHNDITYWIDSDTPGTLDLMPLELIVTEDIVIGNYFTFDFLLHNYSSVTATGSWQVGVFLSNDNIIDASDMFIGSAAVDGPIGSKGTVQKHLGFTVPCDVNPQPYFMGVHVDCIDANTGNNWTRLEHAVLDTVTSDPPPPTPLPTHPFDWSTCQERDDLPLMWTNSGWTCEYEVEFGPTPYYGTIYSTTSTHYTVSNLLASTWYYWRVRARDGCSAWSGWSDLNRFRTEHSLYTPAALVAPPEGTHCIGPSTTLQWTGLPGAESYDVRISPIWCYEGDVITDIPTNQVTVSDLLPNTTYYWAVRAHNECGQTTYWSSSGQFCYTFKTAPTAIDTPITYYPADGTSCGAADTYLGWSPTEDSDHSEVQVGTSCGTGPVYSTTGNSYAAEGLESEVVYYWRVRTFHECGLITDWTPCWSFSLDIEPPDNPATLASNTHLVETWSSDNTVDTWWDTGWDDCIGSWPQYATLWDRSPTTAPTEPTTSGELTFETSPPLDEGQDHWFHLRTVDWAGNLAIDTMHLGPFWIDAAAPSDVVITRVSLPANLWGDYGELTVEWAPATDGASGVAGYSYALEPVDGAGPDATVDTTLESVTLPLGTGNHWFRILAADAAGNLGSTTEAGPFLVDELLPAFIVPVAGQEAVEDELLQVQWEAPIGGLGTDAALHLSLDGGQSFTQIASLTDPEFLDGLYTWTVPSETTDEAVLKLTFEVFSTQYSAGSHVFSLRATTEVEDDGPQAAGAALVANYPNPFNPRTTIAYTLGEETRVRVTVLDALGRRVRTLVDWVQEESGRHEAAWDGTNEQGLRVSSGVYFSCLETPSHRELKRMVLVK